MSVRFATIAISAVLLAAPAHAVVAPGTCGERVMLMELLRAEDDLLPKSYGLRLFGDERTFMALYLDGKQWALVEHKVDGTACVIAVGHEWRDGAIGDEK